MNRQSINFRQKAQRHNDTTSAATATETEAANGIKEKWARARARLVAARSAIDEGRVQWGVEWCKGGKGGGVDLRSARRGNYYKMIKTTKTKSNQCANWTWTWPDTLASDRIASYRIGSVRDSITIITIGYARFTKSQEQQQRRRFSSADTDTDTVSGRALTCIYNFYKKLKSRSRIKTKLINGDVDRVCVCVSSRYRYTWHDSIALRACVCVWKRDQRTKWTEDPSSASSKHQSNFQLTARALLSTVSCVSGRSACSLAHAGIIGKANRAKREIEKTVTTS